MSFQVRDYLNRIQYKSDIVPTLHVLSALQKQHLLTVPFENLDIHYKRYMELDEDQMFSKLITNNRGSFCYELNGNFYRLLKELGFKVDILSACVFDKRHDRYNPEYDHLTLLVEIDDNKYISDVGFGEFVFAPLRFETAIEQIDERGKFKIDRHDDQYFRISKWEDEDWFPQFIFTTKPRKLAEFRDRSHYHQTSSESHFTEKKMISKATENGRITLHQNEFKITENDKIVHKESVNGADKFAWMLLEYFEIDDQAI